MQVFLPFKSLYKSASCLDPRRLNKQIIELNEIIAAINGNKAWRNHPVVKMYAKHPVFLFCYLQVLKAYVDNNMAMVMEYSERGDVVRPSFITEEFCDQHKRRLYTKDPKYYKQFAEYGTSEVNWYVVDGFLKKYKDGYLIEAIKLRE